MSGHEVHALAEALTHRWGATLGRFDELDAEDVIEHLRKLGYSVRLIARESSVLELCVGLSHRRGCHHWERLQRENAALRALVQSIVGAAREYLLHDGSGLRRQDHWAGDWDAMKAAEVRKTLRALVDAQTWVEAGDKIEFGEEPASVLRGGEAAPVTPPSDGALSDPPATHGSVSAESVPAVDGPSHCNTLAGKALSDMGPAFAGGMTFTQFDEYLCAIENEARADEQSKAHTFDGGNPCEICAEAVKPYIAFLRGFVSWADDGESDDDGLIAQARDLLATRT